MTFITFDKVCSAHSLALTKSAKSTGQISYFFNITNNLILESLKFIRFAKVYSAQSLALTQPAKFDSVMNENVHHSLTPTSASFYRAWGLFLHQVITRRSLLVLAVHIDKTRVRFFFLSFFQAIIFLLAI